LAEIDLGIPGIADVVELAQSPAYSTYQVRDTSSGHVVLIKVVHAAERPPSVVERFASEQAVLVELAGHPNIVSVLGQGTTASGEPFVVTEVPSATTAADRSVATPPMTGPEVLRLGVRAAGALESMHRGGVLHVDLRPTNIVLSDAGEPGIADAGLVTLTGATITANVQPRDLEHVSPEQLDGQALSPASDQFSLATTLYRLLAGEAAFVRASDTSAVPVIKRIATEAPSDLKAKGVPPAVADVVHKALSKNPADRYPSLQALARALQQAEVALGLPVTDLTVMTPDTKLPTAWPTATPAAAAPVAGAPGGPPSGAPAGGPPPGSGPPPSGASKSRTPLLIGIGVGVVILLIAGFLITRGGDDKKDASSSVTTTTRRRSTTTKPDSDTGTDTATDTETDTDSSDFAPPGFITVNEAFTNGDLDVFVPDDWLDRDPVELDNGEPRLRVAPNVNAFIDGTFTSPGVQIDAFGVEENGVADPNNLDALLDNFINQPQDADGVPGGPAAAVCTPGLRGNYPDDLGTTSDGGFTGRFDILTGCKGAGSLVVIFATPADQSFILQIVLQTVSPDDEAAIPTIAGSVLVLDFP
jgi:serine/threonine protein kinase